MSDMDCIKAAQRDRSTRQRESLPQQCFPFFFQINLHTVLPLKSRQKNIAQIRRARQIFSLFRLIPMLRTEKIQPDVRNLSPPKSGFDR